MEDWDLLPDRRYLEAYPRLRIAKAVRGALTGYDHILWRDQNGEPLGTAVVHMSAPDALRVRATIFATRHLAEFEGEFLVPLVQRKAGDLRMEHHAVCSCGRDVKILIYKRHGWRCSKCQKLINRSAIVSRSIRLTEQLSKLTELIGDGRRPNMHNSTYQRILNERDWIERELGEARSYASSDYTDIVTGEYTKTARGWSHLEKS